MMSTRDVGYGRKADAPDARDARRAVLWLIALGSLVRLCLAASLGLGVDESYAAAVARPLAWGYFEHPPLVFWLSALASSIGGWSPSILRLPFIAMFAMSTWLAFRLGARLFGARAGMWTAAALSVAPVLSVAAGGWVVPDGPLDLALLAGTLCLVRATDVVPNGRAPNDRPDARESIPPAVWWLAAGFCAGVALLAKYHGAFLLLGGFVFVATTPVARRWLRHPAPYAAALLAIVCFSPVLVWNARHRWISFTFQAARPGHWDGLHPTALLQSVAGQALWLGPWVWLPLIVAFAAAVRRGPRDPRRWLLCCVGAGPIVVFTLATLGGRPGLPHWQAPGYLLLLPLLGASLARAEAAGRVWPRRWIGASAATLVVIAGVAASDVRSGWVQDLLPGLFVAGDPSTQALDWTPLRAEVARPDVRRRIDFVAVSSWVSGGKVGYALRGALPVLCVSSDPHQFAFQSDARAYIGRDAYVVAGVAEGRAPAGPPPEVTAAFDRVEPLPDVPIVRGGRVVLRLHAYLGHGFRGTPVQLAADER
jgi:4-amino-4-deoxy-L-arabinose transferase-like glycosyltransferase